MMEPVFYGNHPYTYMHLAPHQRQKLSKEDLHLWAMQRQAASTALAASFLNLPPTVFEEDTDAPVSTATSNSSNGASTSPLIMVRDHPDRAQLAFHKFGGNVSHRFLPNGDYGHSQDRFRSLNRPKLGINAISGPFSQQSFLPRKISKSDWDLRVQEYNLHSGPHMMVPNAHGYVSSTGTSVAGSADNQTEQESEHSVEQQGVMRRHHGHYFSNIDLFSQPNNGFNYLKYAKANDFEVVNNGSPHVRILDFSFELDPRSKFDKVMLQSNASLQVLHNINFDLVGGDTLALMYTSEPELKCFFSILTGYNIPKGKVNGILEINGHHLKCHQFADRTAFVPLIDPPKWLTTIEYLEYYTTLIHPATNAVPRKRLIEQLIHGLALGPLRKRLCKELSWTEKQRLKLAAQMVLDTDILITENIIQNMDLYDAAFVIDFIRDWAQRFNRIVIMATIPPTIEVLTMFKKVAIMSSGKIIYFGESASMCDYFESIGFQCPQLKNPCDYYVDLVTHDLLSPDSALESSARIRTLADLWQHKRPPPIASQGSIVSPKTTRPSPMMKIFILYLRFWNLFFNRPWPRLGEFFFGAVFSLVVGWLYFDIPKDRRSGIDDREGFICSVLLLLPCLLSLISLERVFEDRKLLNFDYSANLYSSGCYLFSKIMFDLPFAIFAGMTVATPAYLMSNINPMLQSSTTALIVFVIPVVASTVITRYSAWIFGYMFKSKIGGSIAVGILCLLNFVFSGFMVHSNDQWKPFGIELQIFNVYYWLRKELMNLVFSTGQESKIYRLLESLVEQPHKKSEFFIDCLKKPVVATKLSVPVLTVTKCLRTTGQQVLSFAGYSSSMESSSFGAIWYAQNGTLTLKMRVVLVFHLIFFLLFSNVAGQAGNPPPAQAPAPGANMNHLLDRPDCAADIQKYCKSQVESTPKDQLSDMHVLECLQDAGYSDTETLTPACEQAVWEVKVALTADERFHNAITDFCQEEIAQYSQIRPCLNEKGEGAALSCMLDHYLQMPKNGKCFQFLSRIQTIIFTDFRLVGSFVKQCGEFVAKLGCGSLTRTSAHKGAKVPHSQGATLDCFIEKLVNMPKDHEATLKAVTNECRHEVRRIAELQSDDWHLDRPLFFACRQDRERFCPEIPAGDGKVFQCLMEKRDDKLMNPGCAKILSDRAGLMGQDYHLAHPLTKACVKEMDAYGCKLQPGFENSKNFHLSWLLLCLENGHHAFKAQEHDLAQTKALPQGQQKLTPFSQECTHEMIVHRGFMVQEFRMSPELVMGCAQEIDKYCSPNGDIEKNGQTIHCLMEHAKMRDERFQLGAQCFGALQQLMKLADIGSNYKVDKVLYASCKTLIEGKCKMDAVSEAGTLTCLMKYVDTDEMTDACEQRLVEVQYFLSRDWTLDPQLYEACHAEAVSRCFALDNWHLQNNPANRIDPGPQVLACLYRASYDEENPLSKECNLNVHRILRARAIRVNLLPDIESSCRDALSEYCSNNVAPQEEMNCLQEHFEKKEFKQVHKQCYDELYKFTQMESKDTKLNRLLTRACRPVIDTYCGDLINEEIDHGDVMECLASHKDAQEMTPKCKSYVNHFELISMRDYHFNYRFTQACDRDIKTYCGSFGQDKGAVIRCLSNIMFEHRILGSNPDLSKDCKKQLRVAYLQQEQVPFDDKEHMADADPTLMEKCDRDIKRLECDKEETFEDVVECLRESFDTLVPECKALIFDREKIEAMDNSFDDELMKQCKFDLNKYCPKVEEGDSALKCLSNSKIIRLLMPNCQKIVRERLREQAKDDRLRPGLLQACDADARHYCASAYEKVHAKQYSEQQLGAVISSCLREHLARFSDKVHIQPACREELANVILEAEFDVQTDPMLYKACKDTINRHCSNKIVREGGRFDTVLECLKADFYTNQIQDQDCARQLARVTQEALVDIHLDPSLFEACSLDIKRICHDVPPGQSRVITCLMDALEVPRTQMSDQCRTKLSERKKLWNIAHDQYSMSLPSSFSGIFQLVAEHPERDSILAWFGGLILVILIIGCCCGRCSKRTHYELKNR